MLLSMAGIIIVVPQLINAASVPDANIITVIGGVLSGRDANFDPESQTFVVTARILLYAAIASIVLYRVTRYMISAKVAAQRKPSGDTKTD